MEQNYVDMVKSISYDQHEIIKWILKLHCKSSIDLDPCYSTGKFYMHGVEPPLYKFDVFPQAEGVIQINGMELPLANETVNTIMFDPPFLATKGSSIKIENESNKTVKRFGVFPTEKELFKFYVDSLIEFYRVLKPEGVLIFKCQDKISSGRQYLSHVFVINEAIKLGYYCKDLFVLLAKSRLVADWQLKNQKNARKFHSYFLVLEKSNKKIEYI